MKKTKGKAIKVIETKEVESKLKPAPVDSLIKEALKNNASIEIMERLFDLKLKADAAMARTEYVKAITRFQEQCPVIHKDKIVKNKDGRTIRYRYAGLDSIDKAIRKPLADNGLTYSFDVEQTDDQNIRVYAVITHEAGHSEKFPGLLLKKDSNEYMSNDSQRLGSSLTFSKRYALCNALGILTADEDNDAQSDTPPQKSPVDTGAQVRNALSALGYEPKTAKDASDIVKKITQLEWEPKNYGEIKGRLELLVKEKQNDHN